MIERAANHEVVESVRLNAAGTPVTNHYTRIGNGLNYRDANGNWIPSEPVVQFFPDGVVCVGASYQVVLGANLNMAGAVDLQTCDQKRIVSRPIGIAFFDPVSGQRVILAKVKDCPPELISSNEIAYPDAFDGNSIQAAVIYNYDVGRFSQDIKFVNLPVAPADFGLGSRTRLEILTAIEQCPTPTITSHVLQRETDATLRATMAQPDLVDQKLDFGGMHMPLGHAFPQEYPAKPSGPPRGVPVAKQLVMIDGQTVLVEAIPWAQVTNQLAKLPQQSAKTDRPDSPTALKLELATEQPNPKTAGSFENRLAQITRSRPILLASAAIYSQPSALNANGFVMDYTIVPSSGPYTFDAGETYLVNSQVYLTGVTFHQGAIIKYGQSFATLTIEGSVSTYYPPTGPSVVFTSMNDNSVGDVINNSSGDPGGGAIAGWELQLEYLDVNPYFGPLDFRYAYGGINVDASAGHSVMIESASFMDLYTAIQAGEIGSFDVGSAYVCSPDYPYWGTDLYEESFPGTVSIGTVSTCVDQDDNGFPGAYTGTTPNQISGLTLWLEAGVGITKNGANQVSTWTDQSGNGNDATATAGSQPVWVSGALNGLPVVQFNSANSQYFTLPSFLSTANAGEAFVVLKVATANPTSAQSLWNMTDIFQTYELYPDQSGNIQEDFGSTALRNVGSPSQPLTQYHVYEVSAQEGNWAAWVKGALVGQSLNNTVSFVPNDQDHKTFLGASAYYFYGYHPQDYFDGDIAEVVIFNRTLTAEERIEVNAYLNNKYGLISAAPDAPANVVAHPISQTQIGLTWSEDLTSGGATRINIERRMPTGGYTVIAQVSDALSYVDSDLDPGVTYYYRLRAVNLNSWSDYSSGASATTLSAGQDAPFGSLLLWLKADSGLAQLGTGTPVDLWADQSGNGNHAIQTTAANQPTWTAGALNGLPVIHFNPMDSQHFNLPDFLSTATAAEAFVVVKVPTANPTSQKSLWFMSDIYNFWELYPDQYGSIQEDFGSAAPQNVGTPSQPLTQYHVYEVSAQPNNWEAWVNGNSLHHIFNNTVNFNNANHETYLGSSGYYFYGYHPWYFFDGDIAEVLIFNRALTSDERTTVNTYLNNKYGLW